ncbi:hypothetical protein MMC12_005804 [Toensbergia leucococca]|nr:hypothetical protein [Toensbergia leucococca]
MANSNHTSNSSSSSSAYERHLQRANAYVRFYGGEAPTRQSVRTERDILEQNHRFIRDEDINVTLDEEKQFAQRYYDSLFREYALIDLSHWREKMVALRWRTKSEVLAGQGQFTCGSLSCARTDGDESEGLLKAFELNFAYVEEGLTKNSLVKVCVCRSCAKKLRKAQEDTKRLPKTSPERKRRQHVISQGRSRSPTRGTRGIDRERKKIVKAKSSEE